MGRKGSFDFHMPVIAKETTSSGIHILSLSLLLATIQITSWCCFKERTRVESAFKTLLNFLENKKRGFFRDAPPSLKFSRYPWMEPLRPNRMSEIGGKWPAICQ